MNFLENIDIATKNEIYTANTILSKDEIGRLESIMGNFQFISDLLATDLMVYTKSKEKDKYVLVDIKKPHGYPTLFMETTIGSVVDVASEPFIKDAFETGRKTLGESGVMISGRPTQQVIYPIYHYDKIIAVIALEKDLYLTDSLLGKNWSKVADDLVYALNQKRHRLQLWPKLTGKEGFILTNNTDEILYSSFMAYNLLVSILGIREKLEGGKLAILFKDFHPTILDTQPVINLETKKYSGIGGTLQITSYDLSENNRIHVLRDISELSLKEKEIKVKGALVKEIHHRVKNNLSAVAALLRMQYRRADDLAVKEAIREAILRLDSISLVHEFLAQADNVQKVAIGQLVRDIVRNLQHTLEYEGKNISVVINCPDDFSLESETATSVALIINELVSNCYEHAFKDMLSGKIIIDIIPDQDKFVIVVKDTGIGLPKGFEREDIKSLGWHIINTLVAEDLNGKIYLNNLNSGQSGTEVKIEAYKK